jgi:hypothetical protein
MVDPGKRWSAAKRTRDPAFKALLALAGTALLAGCGSQAKTASLSPPGAAGSSASTSATGAATTTTQTTTSTNSSAQGTVGANGGNEAPSSSHGSSAPAFVEEESHEGSLAHALAVVRAHGYTANDTSDYHPDQTLRVLVGTRTGSADGHQQQAFFFVDGRYIGTDSSQPSAAVKVVAQGDTEVTLAYQLYKPGQPLCCATGGEAQVRFQLNNGKLAALDPIPPVESKTGSSRQ